MKTPIITKFGNMRKLQPFNVNISDRGTIFINAPKAGGWFNMMTGRGALNTKSSYLFKPGTIPFQYPPDFVTECYWKSILKGSQEFYGGYISFSRITEVNTSGRPDNFRYEAFVENERIMSQDQKFETMEQARAYLLFHLARLGVGTTVWITKLEG